MKVTVLSNFDAGFYTQKSPWIHISVTDSAPGFHHPRNRCRHKLDVLYLRFSDVTPQDFEKNPAFRIFEPYLFNADHAGHIIAFLEKHKNAAANVIVNCEAGISRSSAIANFILEYFDLKQERFAPPHYHPNPYVLELLREVAARCRCRYCNPHPAA